MKKELIICLFAIAFATSISAQNYQISFAVIGGGWPDSVKVENIAQSTDLTIAGDDVLHLVAPTGISNLHSDNIAFEVFPNPVTENAIINYNNEQSGNVTVLVTDIVGKTFFNNTDYYSQGKNTFQLSGLGKSTYIVSFVSQNNSASAIIISQTGNIEDISINYIGNALNLNNDNKKDPSLKSTKAGSLVEMDYNEGEELKFTANLNEMQSIIDNFSATQDKLVEFSFNYLVTFTVTDGANPIQDASISINSQTLTTDTSGLATVSLSNGTYPYTIAADGYNDITDGSLTVNNGAVDESISMHTNVPMVTTNEITNIKITTAYSGGNIIFDGDSLIEERGVCWSTSNNPTLDNNKTTTGEGTRDFSSIIVGLLANTTYYVRAYAVSGVDTVYGNVTSFITQDWNYFTDDRDGKTYKTVTLGSQIWMAENLNFAASGSWTYSDGEYGRYYTWNTATNVCPIGWHLPSSDEWNELAEYLGGYSIAGGKLKEAGTEHWRNPNTGATNESDFSALPAAQRHYTDGIFRWPGESAYFWTSNGGGYGSTALIQTLSFGKEELSPIWIKYEYGSSVRCVKD